MLTIRFSDSLLTVFVCFRVSHLSHSIPFSFVEYLVPFLWPYLEISGRCVSTVLNIPSLSSIETPGILENLYVLPFVSVSYVLFVNSRISSITLVCFRFSPYIYERLIWVVYCRQIDRVDAKSVQLKTKKK